MTYLSLAWSNLWNFINSEETLHFALNNRFFIVLLVLVLSSLRKATYTSMWAASLVNIPGTFLHECAHFFVGFLLNAKPTSFSLLAQKQNDVYVMGSVGFKNLRFYNAFPSALAPLLLLVLGFWFNQYFFSCVPVNIWTYLGYILLQCIIIENALPSATDFRVAFKFLSGNLFYALLLIAILIFYVH